MKYIKFFNELELSNVDTVGGKNASLGQMYSNLSELGIKVPNGFAITAQGYNYFIEQNNLKDRIEKRLEKLDISDFKSLREAGGKVRKLILNSTMPQVLQSEIIKAYNKLGEQYNMKNLDVAVRSSGTAEDLPDASFAGQQDTYLNIDNIDALLYSVKRCFASLFTDRAISYRQSRGYNHLKVAISVGIQKMVRSDLSSSGVMFSIDTESGNENLIMINSIYGIGENIVSGRVTPDEFVVFKPMLKAKKSAILKRKLGNKNQKMIYDDLKGTKNIKCEKLEQSSFSLSDTEVTKVATYGLKIEEYYSKLAGEYRPMDIEWAKDGQTGEIYIVQARPETVQAKKIKEQGGRFLQYTLNSKVKEDDILVDGIAVGDKIGKGCVKVIKELKDAEEFNVGDVLVTKITDPDWEPLMKKAAAVVTDKGGRTCHAAIVAREIGVPAIVGCNNATKKLKQDTPVTINCSEGEHGVVLQGLLDFEVEELDSSNLKPTNTKIYINVGDPRKAFAFAKFPNEGVGLARMEFIINNYIKAHPMALVDMTKGKKVSDITQIKKFMKGYNNPKEFFVDKLSEGVGTIAAAFYPKPVVVRTSDFKSNEYKYMPGGLSFEKDEENPMIGFRGASRYYSEQYKEAFIWECEALKKVRDEMGLTNVKLMLPFVRTPEEGKKVIEIMNSVGLIQGKKELEIYAMCEIPSNVIFADEFLKIFDGYSIGSNDLTQLMLGVDRDSELVAEVFDERDESVTRMIKMAIDACKKENKYIGICGQAPSDYPEITKFLVENQIDSISLNPDSVFKMWQVVEELEN